MEIDDFSEGELLLNRYFNAITDLLMLTISTTAEQHPEIGEKLVKSIESILNLQSDPEIVLTEQAQCVFSNARDMLTLQSGWGLQSVRHHRSRKPVQLRLIQGGRQEESPGSQ